LDPPSLHDALPIFGQRPLGRGLRHPYLAMTIARTTGSSTPDMAINLKTLIGKLNDTCRQAAERAASLCMARGNWEVDLEHLFLALMEQPRSDLALVARRSGIAPGKLEHDLSAE